MEGRLEASIAKNLKPEVVQQILEKLDGSGHLICWSKDQGKSFDIYLVNDPQEVHDISAASLLESLKRAAMHAVGKEDLWLWNMCLQ